MKLNAKHLDILQALDQASDSYGCGSDYMSFAGIIHHCEILNDRAEVRRIVRALARKGLTEYGTGLWDDEGPAGAGYHITKAGQEALREAQAHSTQGETGSRAPAAP